MSPAHRSATSAAKANNAIGAFFLSIFGAVWLAAWCINSPAMGAGALLIIAVVSITLLAFAVRLYRRNGEAYAAYRNSVEGKRSSIVVGVVNGLQWVLIFVLASALPKASGKWFIPGVIFIVGAHFIPLAFSLRYRPYLYAAAALLLLAASCPWLSATNPQSPLGALGTGVILWLVALYQLAVEPVSSQSGAPVGVQVAR
jgi:hypothetical protein